MRVWRGMAALVRHGVVSGWYARMVVLALAAAAPIAAFVPIAVVVGLLAEGCAGGDREHATVWVVVPAVLESATTEAFARHPQVRVVTSRPASADDELFWGSAGAVATVMAADDDLGFVPGVHMEYALSSDPFDDLDVRTAVAGVLRARAIEVRGGAEPALTIVGYEPPSSAEGEAAVTMPEARVPTAHETSHPGVIARFGPWAVLLAAVAGLGGPASVRSRLGDGVDGLLALEVPRSSVVGVRLVEAVVAVAAFALVAVVSVDLLRQWVGWLHGEAPRGWAPVLLEAARVCGGSALAAAQGVGAGGFALLGWDAVPARTRSVLGKALAGLSALAVAAWFADLLDVSGYLPSATSEPGWLDGAPILGPWRWLVRSFGDAGSSAVLLLVHAALALGGLVVGGWVASVDERDLRRRFGRRRTSTAPVR